MQFGNTFLTVDYKLRSVENLRDNEEDVDRGGWRLNSKN
jgi:hypothetical protein